MYGDPRPGPRQRRVVVGRPARRRESEARVPPFAPGGRKPGRWNRASRRSVNAAELRGPLPSQAVTEAGRFGVWGHGVSVVRWFDEAPVAQVERARAEAARFADLTSWWEAADRGDWMLWVAGRSGVDSRLLVQAALDCARLVIDALDEDGQEVCAAAMAIADLWTAGRVGPGECRAAAQKVYREAERTVPLDDPRLAAGRTSALGAVESSIQAAAWSDDRGRCAEFASDAARRVATTWGRIDGPEEQDLAHRRCAAAVRARISARLLP